MYLASDEAHRHSPSPNRGPRRHQRRKSAPHDELINLRTKMATLSSGEIHYQGGRWLYLTYIAYFDNSSFPTVRHHRHIAA
jgi:hypothetical protein